MSLRVSGPNLEQTVTEVAVLDQVLDACELQLTEPSLIKLTGLTSTLSIGLGDPAGSVALYLDEDRRPWTAHGEAQPDPTGRQFTTNDAAYGFYPSATITTADARHAAREFLATGHKPSSLQWSPEPAAG